MSAAKRFVGLIALGSAIAAVGWVAVERFNDRHAGEAQVTLDFKPLARVAGATPASVAGDHARSKPAAPASVPSFLYIKYLDEAPSADPTDPAAASASEAGAPIMFPPSRLRVSGSGEGSVRALLFSDDPKEAIDKDWKGDRYYFSMPLDRVSDPHNLDHASYFFTASASEKEETANGVFLDGNQRHLEPIQITVELEGSAPNLKVRLIGQFLQYDANDPSGKPRRCQVMGNFTPIVETEQ